MAFTMVRSTSFTKRITAHAALCDCLEFCQPDQFTRLKQVFDMAGLRCLFQPLSQPILVGGHQGQQVQCCSPIFCLIIDNHFLNY
jgi:hypothetical protein